MVRDGLPAIRAPDPPFPVSPAYTDLVDSQSRTEASDDKYRLTTGLLQSRPEEKPIRDWRNEHTAALMPFPCDCLTLPPLQVALPDPGPPAIRPFVME